MDYEIKFEQHEGLSHRAHEKASRKILSKERITMEAERVLRKRGLAKLAKYELARCFDRNSTWSD